MWLLLLEALLALSLFVFIVAWTMWPKRKEIAGKRPGEQGAEKDDEGAAR